MVVGVGNELRGDDGWGPRVARLLVEQVGPEEAKRVFDCGEVPENYLGPILASRPEAIVICDAVDFGAAPGTVSIIEFSESGGGAISTHNAPLALLAGLLAAESGADVFLLGVQPAGTQFAAPLSPAVEQSAAAVVEALAEHLRRGT